MFPIALLNPLILAVASDPDAILLGRGAGRTGKFLIWGCGVEGTSTGETCLDKSNSKGRAQEDMWREDSCTLRLR